MTRLTIHVQRLPHSDGIPIPSYATEGAAGMDLAAACLHDVTLLPGQRALVPTGLIIEVPAGYEAQIRARSGLALKSGLGIPNGPGTVDSDYRGEVSVLVINWSDQPQTIRRGDRIAQMIIAPVVRAELIETDSLTSTGRGPGGFGHTGI